MIFTERTITVVNDSATINKPLILYRGDKNIELKITIAESQFKFRNTDASNVIETTDASYAQLVINTPYNSPIFSDVAVTKNGAVIFVITEAMIDEIREVGAYEIQIRLLDDNKQSRASIPPVSNAIEIREPIAIEDGSTVDSNAVNVAKVNRALTTTSAPLEAFDSQGNYIKKTWGDGDPITDAALNKMEAGIDGVNKKIANNSSQIKEEANTINKANEMQFGSLDGCCVSFVTDDGQKADHSIWFKQIFEPEGVPANDCLITDNIGSTNDWMTIEDIKELKDNGWTVASHSASHIQITGKTEDEIYNDLLKSKEVLKKYNLDDDFYISPYGGYNEIVDKVCRKLFRCHFTTGYKFNDGASDINGTGKTGIFDNYKIYRRNGIGETASGYEVTKENMIEDIEYAKKNKLWLVFCMHSHYEKFTTGNGVSELREVIQYCKNNNIPIVNLREGFRLKGNKIDLGDRNVSDDWLRIDSKGNEFKHNIVSDYTSTTDSSSYVKIATLEVRKQYSDIGLKFDYHVTNISGDDGNTTNGSVTAIFRNNNGSNLDKIFFNNVETIPKYNKTNFEAKQVEFSSDKSIIEIYAVLNKTNSRISIFNINEIKEDEDKSYIKIEKTPSFFTDITTDFTADIFGKTFVYDKKPDFGSSFKGQLVIDTTNKDVYLSYDTGYNKWISLTGEQGTFSPTIIGKTTEGTPTYTTQEGKYIKFGKMVYFTLKLQGSFDGTQDGNMVISGLPISANGSHACNIGYQSGFGNNSLSYAYISGGKEIYLNKISTDGGTANIVGTDCSSNFNIWISGNYISW